MNDFDAHVLRSHYGIWGFLGNVSSSFTLAWLAAHRRRLRTLILSRKRLTLLIIYDTQGTQPRQDGNDPAVDEAIGTLVWGPR